MNCENSLLELPRQAPPCGANMNMVRFIGPKPSGDLELSTLELPRSPLVYTAIANPSTVSVNPLKTNQASQTETDTKSTVNKSCQTDLESKSTEHNVPVTDLVTMIQRQDQKLENLHDKLELILSRIDERKECSCNVNAPQLEEPPALDNVLGQVKIMLNSPRTPLLRTDSANHKVDQSAAFDALAMKYLRSEEMNSVSKTKRDTDMSLATAAYLQRHHLPH